MAIELSKLEQKIEHLLKMGGAEIPESDTRSEEEARSASRKAAKLIRQNDLQTIDLKAFNASWQKAYDALKNQTPTSTLDLQAARQEAKKLAELLNTAQQNEIEARRQVDQCQSLVEQMRRHHLSDVLRAQDPKKIQQLQDQLEAAKQEARAAAETVRLVRKEAVEARQQVDACSNLVTRLKAEGPPSTSELVRLSKQVEDLTFRSSSAQAAARACEGLRAEELARYETRLQAAPPPHDSRYVLVAGLLAGSVLTMVGGLILRKVGEPTPEQRRQAGRIAGT